MRSKRWIVGAAFLVLAAAPARADAMLTDFPYPYAVKSFSFMSQGQTLAMAYMDVPPSAAPNGRTVVLFHGKNFCAATGRARSRHSQPPATASLSRTRSASANRRSPQPIR